MKELFSTSEVQIQICHSLKKLLQDFVSLRSNAWSNKGDNKGDWIYAIPFIHAWDLSEEAFEEWFPLNDWKQSLQKYKYELRALECTLAALLFNMLSLGNYQI